MKKNHITLSLIILFALALRLFGIDFEVPHPDDYISVQAAMHFGPSQVELSGHGLYGLYVWPSTGMVYIEVVLFSLYYVIGWLIGVFPDMESFRNLYLNDPFSFYLIGRIMCVFFGVGTIMALYSLGRRLYDHRVALLAAFFLSGSFIYSVHSQFIRPDVPTTFIIVLTMICCLSIIEKGQSKYYIVAGVLAGFATSIKFTSGILVMMIVLTHILAEGTELLADRGSTVRKTVLLRVLILIGIVLLGGRFAVYAFDLLDMNTLTSSTDEVFNNNVRHFANFLMNLLTLAGGGAVAVYFILKTSSRALNVAANLIYDRKLLQAVAAFLLSFMIFDPVFFLDFKKQVLIFITDANYMGSQTLFIGVDSLGFWGNLWWYIKGALNWGAGTVIEVMAGLGLLLVLSRKRKEDMPALVFALVYLLIISLGKFRWERYAVTLMPFMALYAADFLYTFMDKVGKDRMNESKKTLAVALIAIMVVIPSVYNTIRYDYLLTQKDTRVVAQEWVQSNVPMGSRVGMDAYTGNLSGDTYHITRKFSLSEEELNYYTENKYDYLIVSDTQYRRYMNEPIKYKENVEFYNQLFKEGELASEIKLSDDVWPKSSERFLKYHIHISPTIRIYKIN